MRHFGLRFTTGHLLWAATLVPAVVAEVNLVNRLDEIDTARLTQLLQDI